jgi:hypothetical protein
LTQKNHPKSDDYNTGNYFCPSQNDSTTPITSHIVSLATTFAPAKMTPPAVSTKFHCLLLLQMETGIYNASSLGPQSLDVSRGGTAASLPADALAPAFK